jgi:nucleoside-diphosphate kinase
LLRNEVFFFFLSFSLFLLQHLFSRSLPALEGENAVAAWRTLMGPTHLAKARAESPASIRGLFALSDTRNCVHGSDSEQTAREELEFFFPDYKLGDETNGQANIE